MERFRKLSNFQKLLLIAQAVMVLVFSVLYAVTVRREGFAYEDGLLMRSEENGDISGQVPWAAGTQFSPCIRTGPWTTGSGTVPTVLMKSGRIRLPCRKGTR